MAPAPETGGSPAIAAAGTAAPHHARLSPEERIMALTVELHDGLEDAVANPGRWRQLLDTSSTLWRYSGGNIALLMLQRARLGQPPPILVAGYKEWERHGRNVIKGEQALWVIAPRTARSTLVELPDGSHGRVVPGRDLPEGARTEGTATAVVGWRAQAVFDVSQTNGEPLYVPRPDIGLEKTPEALWNNLVQVARERRFRVDVDDRQLALSDGYTDFAAGRIQVGSWLGSEDRTATLAHEIGHVYLHGPGHEVGKLYGSSLEHRGLAEVEAESVAYTVLRTHGIDRGAQSASYLAGWSDAVLAVEGVSNPTAGNHRQLTRVDIAKSVLGRVTATCKTILESTKPPGFGGKPVGAGPDPSRTIDANPGTDNGPAPTVTSNNDMTVAGP